MQTNLQKTWHDFSLSLSFWRIFCLIGITDIRNRYKRSKLGQLWLTISTCVNIGALAVVWGLLFKISIRDYIPFIAISQIIWLFISSCIIEGASIYISSTHYLKELTIPKFCYINSLFVRNLVVLLHNLVVLIPIYIFSTMHLSWISILSLLGFTITILFLFGIVLLVAMIGLRFRDTTNIVTSMMQIAFYVTPVLWKPDFMPERVQQLMIYNPFAVFLSLCRDPLLGINIPNEYWLVALTYTALSLIISFLFFSKFRARIVYWL